MTRSLLASRYARALFDLALEHKISDRVEQDLLQGLKTLESEEFAALLFHPKIQKQVKKELLERLFKESHNFLLDFVCLVVDKGREKALPAIVREYVSLATAHRGEIKALVTSAVPLTSQEIEGIRAKLGSSARHVVVEETVDESILGGLIIRVGNKIYDGSVAERMKRLRSQLTQAQVGMQR